MYTMIHSQCWEDKSCTVPLPSAFFLVMAGTVEKVIRVEGRYTDSRITKASRKIGSELMLTSHSQKTEMDPCITCSQLTACF